MWYVPGAPSSRKTEAEELQLGGYHGLHKEFQTSWGYILRACLKIKKRIETHTYEFQAQCLYRSRPEREHLPAALVNGPIMHDSLYRGTLCL